MQVCVHPCSPLIRRCTFHSAVCALPRQRPPYWNDSLIFRISPDFPGMPSWASHLWIMLSEHCRRDLVSNYFVRGRSALGWALKRHLPCSIAIDYWHSRKPLNRIYSVPTRIYSLKVVLKHSNPRASAQKATDNTRRIFQKKQPTICALAFIPMPEPLDSLERQRYCFHFTQNKTGAPNDGVIASRWQNRCKPESF